MKKNIFLFFLIQLLVVSAFSQTQPTTQIKYKDLYESLRSKKDYEAFQALFNFQAATTSKEYVNINGYYQMGILAQRMMRQYDPFLDPANTKRSIDDAKLYLSLTLYHLDEKEVKKNEYYYQNVMKEGKKVTYEEVKKDIEGRIEDVNTYKEYFEQDLSYLKNCITKYNACIDFFNKINMQNSRLNDLYFLVDDEMKQNLNDLQLNFDSTLHYLNKLKYSLNKYSLGGYRISYSLAPINVYRLHGLTSTNFIGKDACLWDFNSWVNTFNSVINSDVAFLYDNVEKIHTENIRRINGLLHGNNTASEGKYKVSPLIINKIYKYDFNSVAAPLLEYQEAKINFLHHNADKESALKPNYYYELIQHKKKVDSTLQITTGKTTFEAIKKYDHLFTISYTDLAGFQSYLANESTDNKRILAATLNVYKNNVLKKYIPASSTDQALQHKNEPFYVDSRLAGTTVENGYYVHTKTAIMGNMIICAGSYINKKAETVAFAALLNSNNSIRWVRVFDKKAGKEFALHAEKFNDGFAVVVAGMTDKSISNILYQLDSDGNIKRSAKLAAQSIPRKMICDEINNTCMVAFKGDALMPYDISTGAAELYLLDQNMSEQWRAVVDFNGYIANIIRTNDQYYVYGAYTNITTPSGEKRTVNHVSPFVHVINASGSNVIQETFNNSFACYPLQVSKINDEYVDIIALKNISPAEIITQEIIDEQHEPYYMILTTENGILYTFDGK